MTLQFRRAELGEADIQARTAPLTLSTEFPVDRGGYYEILSHAPGDVDLSRSPLPLIVSHDGDELPVGVVEGLEVDGKRLRGVARFSESERGQQVFRDVQQRIARSVSVGYEYRSDGVPIPGKPDHIRFAWAPFEASVVAIPADPRAGFFRGHGMDEHLSRGERRRAAERAAFERLDSIAGEDADAFTEYVEEIADEEHQGQRAAALRSMGGTAAAYEGWRTSCITSIGESWARDYAQMAQMARRAIAAGHTCRQFREAALSFISDQHRPLETGRLEAGVEQTTTYGAGARAASHFDARNDRDRQERIHHAAGRWFRGTFLNSGADRAWCKEAGLLQARAMVEGNFSTGGALVPVELANEIVVLADAFGVIRRVARTWEMNSASLQIPRETAQPSASFVGEVDSIPPSDPGFDQVQLTARNLAALVKVSRSLAEDAPAGTLGSYLVEALGRKVAEVEDRCAFIGDGTSAYGGMTGVCRLIEDANYSGSRVTTLSGDDTFAEVEAADIAALLGRLPEYAKRGARFYMSSSAKDNILTRLAASAAGNTLETLQNGVVRWLGYPIELVSVMPSDPQADLTGVAFIVFGDFRLGVAFGDRKSFELMMDPSVFFDQDALAFRVVNRFDVVVHGVPRSTTQAGAIVGLVGNS